MTSEPVYLPTEPLGDWSRNPNRGCVQPGVDPTVFFPGTGGVMEAQIARGICRRCPVRVECGDDALAHAWVWGIWGGTSTSERRNMRRRGITSVAS